MDIVGTFVRVDRLEVEHVADHAVLINDTVPAKHVASNAGDLESLAAVLGLIIEIISGASDPASLSLPTWSAARRP